MKRTGPFSSSGDEREAAWDWLARRDRGLTPVEQREFATWLAADARRETLLREIEEPFRALDRAAALRSPGVKPDPDFLLKLSGAKSTTESVSHESSATRRTLRFPLWTVGLATAAAIVVGALTFQRSPVQPAERGYVARHVPRLERLPDGSKVELKGGAEMEIAFTAGERRVRLSRGDAHFTVTKDPARPFIVVAGGVAVRAVGTAFTVSQAGAGLEVVVWEGRVRVDDLEGRSLIAEPAAPAPAPELAPKMAPTLATGQRVVIPTAQGVPMPVPIAAISAEEMARAFAWRNTWLEFVEMPLAKVLEEFGKHESTVGRRRIRLADPATERVLVSGTFRADEIGTFIRLLDSSFDVASTTESDGAIMLRKAR